jgi:hypothetical protein
MQSFYAIRKEHQERTMALRAQTWKKTGHNQTMGGMYISEASDWTEREI